MNIKDTYVEPAAGDSKKLKFIMLLLIGLAALLLLHTIEAPLLALVQDHWERLREAYQASPRGFVAGFVLVHIAVLACFIPLGIALMLLAGALFGVKVGVAAVAIAYTIGAVLNFLTARYFLEKRIIRNFPAEMAAVQRGLRKHGVLYLAILRVIPLIPSPVVNVVFGVIEFPLLPFVLITAICPLPLLTFYVNLGTHAWQIASWSNLLKVLGLES